MRYVIALPAERPYDRLRATVNAVRRCRRWLVPAIIVGVLVLLVMLMYLNAGGLSLTGIITAVAFIGERYLALADKRLIRPLHAEADSRPAFPVMIGIYTRSSTIAGRICRTLSRLARS